MKRKMLAIVLALTLAASVHSVALFATAKEEQTAAFKESTEVPDLDVGSKFVLGNDMSTRNIIASAIDGINITVKAKGDVSTPESGKDQFVSTRIKLVVNDFTGKDSLIIRADNSFMGASTVGVSLVDNDGSIFRTDKDFSDGSNTAEKNKYYLLKSLDDTAPVTKYLHSMAMHLPDGFNGFVKIPFASFGYRWSGDENLDLANISHIEFEVDTHYNEFVKINVGEIGAAVGSEITWATDATKYNIVTDAGAMAGNEVFKVFNNEGGRTADHLAITKVLANRMLTKRNYPAPNQWSSFMISIPSDISAYNGISYYVDTTGSGTDIFFNKYFREWTGTASGEEWYCDGGFATYQPDGGESFIGDTNNIPKGFKGRITVPFTNFFIPSWFGAVVNSTQDLNSVWRNFGFTFDVSRGEYNFVLKDVKFTASAREFVRLPQIASWQGDVKTVLPFDYQDDFDLNSDWNNAWDKAANCETTCVDTPVQNVPGVSGKAMRFVCGDVKSVAEASDETALEHFPSGEQKNISAAKGFTFWIKNTSSTQIGFNFGFDLLVSAGKQQRWTSKINARYMLFNTKTGEEFVANGKGAIYVPSGFEGWVRIDFSQFERPSWETNSADFDKSKPLAYMVMNMNSKLHQGDSFILDSFGFYHKDVAITTTFNTPANSFTEAMTTPYTEE